LVGDGASPIVVGDVLPLVVQQIYPLTVHHQL
jgi:hypothetical protein